MQIAQLYLGMWMAGGVLALGSLLVGNYGRRLDEVFSPSVGVATAAGSLTLAGLTGIAFLVTGDPCEGQLDSLVPSLSVGAFTGLSMALLQRHAAARLPPACDNPGAP